jgi:hypothetical protein
MSARERKLAEPFTRIVENSARPSSRATAE